MAACPGHTPAAAGVGRTREIALLFWTLSPDSHCGRIFPAQAEASGTRTRRRRSGAGGRDRARARAAAPSGLSAALPASARFMPPLSALGPLFRYRFEQIYLPRVGYHLDVSTRSTSRVLGGYYKSRRLVRIYARDRVQGLRPLEELFDTFLHEMAHHLEYTEPFSFAARACGRIPGRMHSRLFWKILGELKYRWARLQEQKRVASPASRTEGPGCRRAIRGDRTPGPYSMVLSYLVAMPSSLSLAAASVAALDTSIFFSTARITPSLSM